MTVSATFDLQRIQKIRKMAVGVSLLTVSVLAMFTTSEWGEGPVHAGVEALGLGAIVICIVGRAWCSLYIGGRKKAEIVDTGPYSISRNPLYVFSYVGAFGIGAQTGSVVLALMFTALTIVVFHYTIKREEAWLLNAFGETYADYRACVPKCGPAFRLWRDEADLVVRPQFFVTTLRDGLVFLLAVPVFEGIGMLQHLGWLAPLIRLP